MHEIKNPAPEPKIKQETSPPPTLTLDVSLYEKYLDSSGMSDHQKREFLETLWSIIVSFVDLGFNISPTQQACGQNAEMIGQQQTDESKFINDTIEDGFDDQTELGVTKKGGPHE